MGMLTHNPVDVGTFDMKNHPVWLLTSPSTPPQEGNFSLFPSCGGVARQKRDGVVSWHFLC